MSRRFTRAVSAMMSAGLTLGLGLAFAPPSSAAIDSDGPVSIAAQVERISGVDRYSTAVQVSVDAFPTAHPPAVYIASGETFPDALATSAAAGARGGPVLLVTKDAVPPSVRSELMRLQPARILIVGGLATLGDAVAAELSSYAPTVERIAGVDRYDGAARVAAEAFDTPPARTMSVFMASGENFPDALAASAAAGLVHAPVLLVRRDSIPSSVTAELDRIQPSQIILVGGPASVSDEVGAALYAIAPTTRLDGPDRYAASARVSAVIFNQGADTVYVASGSVFPDALAGSAAAIRNRAPMLLVTTTGIPSETQAELRRLRPHRIVVLGGADTISETVLRQLDTYLGT